MPPESKKLNILSRVFSRFSNRRSQLAAAPNQLEGSSSSIVAAGPSSSDHSSTHSVPDLSVAVDNSTPLSHGSQPPIRQSRSENEIVDFSQSTATSMHYYGQHDPLQPPPPFPALQSSDNPSGSRGATPSFFPGASGFQMRDFNVSVGGAGDNSIDGWERLLKNTAPNALHDSDARYDPPKCDEDTRIEVIGEITDWIKDRDGPQRLLCMTGAAGSGKSALQQTTAEICQESGILSSTFFFSASDPTRNTVKSVIPTIAYQLGRTSGSLRRWIKAAVENDPLIFSKSLRTQMSTLIVAPSQRCKGMDMDLTTLPYAILIDGLDECTGEDRQAELLTAVKECLLANDLPFRVFIASRPEWAIRTALEPGGHLSKVAYHIQLSDQYDASADMRRYLRRRFEYIGLRIGDLQWFTEDNIETLVQAASGQFVYVATVFKYISERRASPVQRLKVILAWTPSTGRGAKPFEALDRLYANILLNAKDAYEAVDTHHGREFLLLFRAYHISATGFPSNSDFIVVNPEPYFLSAWLFQEDKAEESLTSDLRSLVAFQKGQFGSLCLHLYHKSFSDFLEEENRAKALFVPLSRVATHLATCLMQHIVECPLEFDFRV